jgi:argininosuccinate synthase
MDVLAEETIKCASTLHCALAPDMKIIAPVREWGLIMTRKSSQNQRYPFPMQLKYSIDAIWGRAIEWLTEDVIKRLQTMLTNGPLP